MADNVRKTAKETYGEKAYPHAKPETPAEKESWPKGAPEKRREAYGQKYTKYREQYEKFKRENLELQTVDRLKNTGKTFTVETGHTLYNILRDYFGMNNHTAFLTFMRLLTRNSNIDELNAGDTLMLEKTGKLVFKQSGKTFEVENVGVPPDSAETAAFKGQKLPEPPPPTLEEEIVPVVGADAPHLDKIIKQSGIDIRIVAPETSTRLQNPAGQKIEMPKHGYILQLHIPESKVQTARYGKEPGLKAETISDFYVLADLETNESIKRAETLVAQIKDWSVKLTGKPPDGILFEIPPEYEILYEK